MDIIVCVKTNPDLQMVRIKDRVAVLEAVPFKIGDLEKNALEAAVTLRTAARRQDHGALPGRRQPQGRRGYQGGAGDGRRRGRRRRATRRWRRRTRRR